TANLFCIAHPKVNMQLEIQPSAFLNTVQDIDKSAADLDNPNFQAYVAQAWATCQADKGNKGTVVSYPHAATVTEEIISPGVQSSCATCQASEPFASAPTSTAVKPYVPLTNPALMPAHKDPVPVTIYCYSFPLKDEATPKCIMKCILETSIAFPVKELFTVAPEFHKQFRDINMAKCVTTNEIKVVCSDSDEGVHVNELTGCDPHQTVHKFGDHVICGDDGSIMAHHTLLLCCIESKVPRTDVTINCMLDSSSEIIAMPR
ncbi:hypothetical protein M404DRAFT_114226, partial [Pisolithus tinctorius Marx 270]